MATASIVITCKSAADFSAARGKPVKYSSYSAGVLTVALCTASTDDVLGVVATNANSTATGEPVEVVISGIAEVLVPSGTATAGSLAMPISGGCVDKTASKAIAGRFLESATGAAGVRAKLLVNPIGMVD